MTPDNGLDIRKLRDAQTYVRSIRNEPKRAYANFYLEFKRGRRPAPDRHSFYNPRTGTTVSAMGAQAVELAICAILKETP